MDMDFILFYFFLKFRASHGFYNFDRVDNQPTRPIYLNKKKKKPKPKPNLNLHTFIYLFIFSAASLTLTENPSRAATIAHPCVHCFSPSHTYTANGPTIPH